MMQALVDAGVLERPSRRRAFFERSIDGIMKPPASGITSGWWYQAKAAAPHQLSMKGYSLCTDNVLKRQQQASLAAADCRWA